MPNLFRLTSVIATLVLPFSCGPQEIPELQEDAESFASVSSALTGLTPQLTSVVPALGPDVGGITVTLSGRNFRPGASVTFGDVPVYSVKVPTSTQIVVTLPSKPGTFGRTPVKVTLPDGKSVVRSDLFYYYSDSLSFRTPNRTSLASQPDSVIAADVNGDGKSDFIFSADESKSVEVYLGQGDGSFQTPKSYPAGGAGRSLRSFDANGDGKLDLFVTTPVSNSVSVLLGNGDGTFQAPQLSAAITGAYFAAVGDFNADGKADVAVSSAKSDPIGVLLGNGDGTFKAAVSYSGGGMSGAKYPAHCAAADLNGDGKQDLVFSIAPEGRISVLLGNGDGTFQAAKVSSTGGFGTFPRDIAIGDWNGDLKPDVVVGSNESFRGSFLLRLGNGDGTLQAATSLSSYSGVERVIATDLNADGKLDLVGKLYPTGVSVQIGKGDGTFVASTLSGITGDGMALADFDGDARLDLVATDWTNRELSIAFGASSGTGFNTPAVMPIGGPPGALLLGDWNGDGKRDLAVARFDNSTVGVFVGNGVNNFRAATASPVSKGPVAAAAGDFNGDGKSDLVTACVDSANVNLLLGKGDGTFQTAKTFATGNSPISVAVADFNADGKLDAVTANYDSDSVTVLLGSGSGTFTVKSYAAGKYPTSVAVGDWNGDAKPDLAVANSETGLVSVLLGSGTGSFGVAKTFATGKNPTTLVAADWNGDGKLDLATSNSDSNNVAVLLGTGLGTFAAAAFVPTAAFPSNLVVADWNSDGKPDLAVACAGESTLQLLLGFGDGSFFPSKSAQSMGSGPLAVGDMNGDGKPDLFLGSEISGTVSVLANATP